MNIEKKEIQKLEMILSKEIKNEKEAYDNIVEMKEFCEYPHGYIPDAENKINEKLYNIQNILGKEILDKGIKIYEMYKFYKDMYNSIDFKKRNLIEMQIQDNPDLAERLNRLFYNPEISGKQKGEIVLYEAVYAKMMEEAKANYYSELFNNNHKL